MSRKESHLETSQQNEQCSLHICDFSGYLYEELIISFFDNRHQSLCNHGVTLHEIGSLTIWKRTSDTRWFGHNQRVCPGQKLEWIIRILLQLQSQDEGAQQGCRSCCQIEACLPGHDMQHFVPWASANKKQLAPSAFCCLSTPRTSVVSECNAVKKMRRWKGALLTCESVDCV